MLVLTASSWSSEKVTLYSTDFKGIYPVSFPRPKVFEPWDLASLLDRLVVQLQEKTEGPVVLHNRVACGAEIAQLLGGDPSYRGMQFFTGPNHSLVDIEKFRAGSAYRIAVKLKAAYFQSARSFMDRLFLDQHLKVNIEFEEFFVSPVLRRFSLRQLRRSDSVDMLAGAFDEFHESVRLDFRVHWAVSRGFVSYYAVLGESGRMEIDSHPDLPWVEVLISNRAQAESRILEVLDSYRAGKFPEDGMALNLSQ